MRKCAILAGLIVVLCASPPVYGNAPQTQPCIDCAPTTDYFGCENCIGKVGISKEPVPMAVYETYRKLPKIEVKFHIKKEVLAMVDALNLKRPEEHKDGLDPEPVFSGTGVPVGRGEIITTEHLISDQMMAAYLYEKYGYNGKWHDGYEIKAYFIVNHEFRSIPLRAEAEEDKYDRLRLKVNTAAFWNTIRQSPPGEQEILKKIFYLLVTGIETAKAEVDEIVYMAGWREVPVDMGNDHIRKYFAPYIFSGKVSTHILNQYSIPQSVEPGYSGGAMITKDGRVAGMLLWISAGRQFTGAIEINDLIPKK